MPPRLSKRQQREQEELQTLGGSVDAAISSDDDKTSVPLKVSGAGFSALFVPEDDEPEGGSDEDAPRPTKARKAKKKKKKDTSTTTAESGARKNVATKSKGKEKKPATDEVDQAIADLSLKYPEFRDTSSSTATSATSSANRRKLASLLSVSLPHLDSEAEMRKFFGSKVVAANRPSSTNPSARRNAGVQKSNLTRPKSTWRHTKQREGLSVRPLAQEELDEKLKRDDWTAASDEKWWTVESSKKYKGMTKMFVRTVLSGDPDGFWALVNEFPWHADTLLQLSEVYRHREEYSQAVDFVERALFTYERSFIGAFTFTTGLNRLDFDRVENRPFFLALHRQIVDLQRRGCVRSSFEFARLLFSLDPYKDPHGALLHLDYLSLKAGMGQWLLDVWDHYHESGDDPFYRKRLNVTCLPGWAYARALALRRVEGKDHTKSQAALEEAIYAFPPVVTLLADKLDLPLTGTIRARKEFAIQTEGRNLLGIQPVIHVLSRIYAQRSFSLWKDPELSSWLSATVIALNPTIPYSPGTHPLLDRSSALFSHAHASEFIWRHVLLHESSFRSLISFIPAGTLHDRSLACDPLPPKTMISMYDDNYFAGTEDLFSANAQHPTRRGLQAGHQAMRRWMQVPELREHLQAVVAAHPELAEIFPGGIAQFAEIADEDMDLMLLEALGRGDGAMPGEIPEDNIALDAEPNLPLNVAVPETEIPADGSESEPRNQDVHPEADDDEDDEDDAPFALRILRNVVNRFWGGRQDDSSDDEDRPGLDEVHGRAPIDDVDD